MSQTTLRVFEHDRLRVGQRYRTVEGKELVFGEREHRALARFADGRGQGLVRLGHDSIRFTQHVGYLQLDGLGIEILPKADRFAPGEAAPWRDALLDMIGVAHELRLLHPTEAQLAKRSGSLFDVFVRHFLVLVEARLHHGLVRGYRRARENRPVFRGRLLVSEHIRHNVVQAQRTFVEHQIYDHDILVNRTLVAALSVLARTRLRSSLHQRVTRLLASFPETVQDLVDLESLERLVLDRRTQSYSDALRLARLILAHHTPAPKSGATPVVALLFDMNRLWERYIAALLRRALPAPLVVLAQDHQAFWRSHGHRARVIKPDIVVRDETGSARVIIDTKWKCPSNRAPSSGDLQQMFVYNERYGCEHALLLYPGHRSARDVDGAFDSKGHRCGTRFIDLFESGTYRRSAVTRRLCELVPSLLDAAPRSVTASSPEAR